jgi:hypothetical protein
MKSDAVMIEKKEKIRTHQGTDLLALFPSRKWLVTE